VVALRKYSWSCTLACILYCRLITICKGWQIPLHLQCTSEIIITTIKKKREKREGGFLLFRTLINKTLLHHQVFLNSGLTTSPLKFVPEREILKGPEHWFEIERESTAQGVRKKSRDTCFPDTLYINFRERLTKKIKYWDTHTISQGSIPKYSPIIKIYLHRS